MMLAPAKSAYRFPKDSRCHYAADRHHVGGAVALAGALLILPLVVVRAEDHIDYRYENYGEEHKRIRIETHSALFEGQLTPWLSTKAEVVYDAISGASPTGSPPASTIRFVPPEEGGPGGPFKKTVPVVDMDDTRYAIALDLAGTFGRHRVAPQFSYSEEDDYISYGAALNYALELNEKNTTINAGWSHTWDTIKPSNLFLFRTERKDADDFMLGVNQLLSPGTVLTANFTYGYSSGYQNDQYKGVLFESVPQLDPVFPALSAEKRPGHRARAIPYVSLTQQIAPANASVELSYRFFHDSYGINANTISLTWFQKLGRHVVVSPVLRYYQQTAARFYGTRFADAGNRPDYYSADYRLSKMETFVAGVSLHVKATQYLGFDAGYRRYVMHGLDHETSQSAYPSANIFTVGIRAWF